MIEGQNWSSKLFNYMNQTLLVIISLITVIPFIHVLAVSFSDETSIIDRKFVLFPVDFSLDAFRYIFSTDTVFISLTNTIFITLVGTFVNILLTALMAYPLARRDLPWRSSILFLVTFTMLFGGGIVPTFLIVKWLGLLNSYWSLIIPTAISAFNLIVLKNFFQQLPEGLEESAKIDGCHDYGILFRIVIPLSLPALTTFSLFYAVSHWNSFFQAILYINDSSKWPIQVLLRQIVLLSQGGIGDSVATSNVMYTLPDTVKTAVIVVATVPILCVYPFLQKHFAKGVMLGSVKG
ncbi:carbohydrate ABC transporter permease [Paenibacillus agricola]|uniref:Carbohydrate ABC transporter permease n=1 Tax=Paenibacillus agricola TaxID=2716264 RepID=A0ABX0J8T1_9BACL|nr:carbohydrate ABC transporter permease [Paenibacillus agricola]NHN30165.1 carbohydrate ABC transporter permease [Paenibacillus agricola]